MVERLFIWLSWKMPRRLVYWCAVRLGAESTVLSNEEVPSIRMMDALRRWNAV